MSLTPDKSSTGLEPTVAAGLAVLLGWLGGLIFFLIEKDSKFVKFYGIQNVFLFLPMILSFIPFVNFIIVLYGLFAFVMWIMCLINAFNGKIFKVPFIGDIAMRQVDSAFSSASSSGGSVPASSPAASSDDDEFGDDD